MSYCRFSSEDFQCDVYVYAHCAGGYATHVAGNRVVFTEPLPARADFTTDPMAYVVRCRQVGAIVEKARRVPIGLPHDGAAFLDARAEECADRLEQLRDLGYRVPQYAIDALRAEHADDDTEDLALVPATVNGTHG